MQRGRKQPRARIHHDANSVKVLMARLGIRVSDLAGLTDYSMPAISLAVSGRRSSPAIRSAIYVALAPLARRAGIAISMSDLWPVAQRRQKVA